MGRSFVNDCSGVGCCSTKISEAVVAGGYDCLVGFDILNIDFSSCNEVTKALVERLDKNFKDDSVDVSSFFCCNRVFVLCRNEKCPKCLEQIEYVLGSVDPDIVFYKKLFFRGGYVNFKDHGLSIDNALNMVSNAITNGVHNLSFLGYEEMKSLFERSSSFFKNVADFSDILSNRKYDLRLAYQPIVNYKTKRLSHFESLLRIYDQKSGDFISAGPFIGAAEGTDLIKDVDMTVLQMVVAELADDTKASLAVNISANSLGDSRWLDNFFSFLSDNKPVLDRLIVEVTETGEPPDENLLRKMIDFLHSNGSTVAMDDFGVGYTSIYELYNFDFDFVKLDGSLIRNIYKDKKLRIIVEAVKVLSERLNLDLIAEFVEDKRIVDVLEDIGVYLFQGNYFGAADFHRSISLDSK